MLHIRRIALIVLCTLLTVSLYADPYSEGRELYKAGRYREAAARLEQAVRDNPSNAKAWWQLNFAYNKLGRYADALHAAERAGSLDPSYSFASTPAKYAETVERLRKKVGSRGGSSPVVPPTESLGPLSGPDGTMSRQLNARGVFVQHGASVDVDRLQRVLRELEPAQVRFLIFGSKVGSRTLMREADRVRRYLGLRDGYVIAASKSAVAVSSEALSKGRLEELTRQAAVRMEAGDYEGGLADLARNLVATRARQSAMGKAVAIWLGGGIVGLVLAFVLYRRMAHARAMKSRRAIVEQRKSEVIAQINYLEETALALPTAVAELVRNARREAGEKLDEALRLVVRARDEYDLTNALGLLDQAAATAAYGRQVADAAATGKPLPRKPGAVPPVHPARATSGPGTDWNAVPEEEKGVCFFCSRPAYLDELTPVSVRLDGEERRVLACRDDYESIRSGKPPRIRAFQREGRYVPWYADPDYDPYRDYYGRGYGTGDMLRDLVLLNLIDRMFWDWHRPSWEWGWGGGHGPDWDGYPFWTDHHRYRDYYAERAAGAQFEDDFGREAAGTDFLDSGFGDDDTRGGGTDFLGVDES